MIATVILTGCDSQDGFPICTSPVVTSPNGNCSAYYFRMDTGGSITTQAMMECRNLGGMVGGNIVSHEPVGSGIALRWLSADVLEVAIHPDVRHASYSLPKRDSGQFGEFHIKYVYRKLTPADPEWIGCMPKS